MNPARTAEDWGRVAVSLPGWRWMPGMLVMSDPAEVPRPVQMTAPAVSGLRARVYAAQLGTWYGVGEYDVDNPDWEGDQCGGNDLPGTLPDLTDPATAGCLEDLSGPNTMTQPAHWAGDGWYRCSILSADGTTLSWGEGSTKGRARIAAAAALGRWPGGEP